MEELIKQIIEIEEKAQEVIRDAKEASGDLEERVNRDTVRMQNDIEKKMKEKNDSLKQLEASEAENKVSAINAQTEKTLAALEDKLRENKNKWVEQIVSGVLAG